jgi:DNA polymerase IIIc chi subunit
MFHISNINSYFYRFLIDIVQNHIQQINLENNSEENNLRNTENLINLETKRKDNLEKMLIALHDRIKDEKEKRKQRTLRMKSLFLNLYLSNSFI